MGLNIGGRVEKINGKELSYSEFVQRYLDKNKPVVLTGLMDEWRACRDWVSTDDGGPNLHFFSSHFGNSRVQVADCGRREFTDQKRVEMTVSGFICQWLELSTEQCNSSSSCEGNCHTRLYLKDWHFINEYPEYVPYTTPLFFCDDWLNLYLDSHYMHRDPDMHHGKNEINCSDYRFVYMGAKGTWTPLHADVFRSYSWSANVCGKKQWHFLSPSQCHLVFDRNMKSSVYDIFDDVSETKFPGFKKAIWLECTQEQNEIIFVPSGWYHQVHNLEDTISINHNWFNAYNLSWVWKLLLKDYNEAKEYIEDIRDISDDFEGLCQRNLAANTGMNFADFFIFVTRLSFANLIQLHHLVKNHEYPIRDSPKAQHLFSNLMSIREVALKMKSIEGFTGNQSTLFNFREALKEPEFLKLCMDLDRTYQLMDKVHRQTYDMKKPLTVGLYDLDFIEVSGSNVSSPEDLISVLDSAVKYLDSMSSNGNFSLLSELDEIETSVVL